VKVNDVFDFSSELQCTINLITLEELLFSELIGCKMLDNINLTPEFIRWNQIKEMNYLTFANDKKFDQENQIIIKHVKKLVKCKNERIVKGSFYVYNRDYSVTTGLHEDDDKEGQSDDDIACLVIPPMEFQFEEKTELKPIPFKSFASQADENSVDFENENDCYEDDEISSKKFHRSFLGSCHLTSNLKQSLVDEELKQSSLDTSLLYEKKPKIKSEKKINYDRSESDVADTINILKKKSFFKIIERHLPSQQPRRSIYHSALCKDIRKVLKENIFSDYVENYSFLKIHRNVLEKIPILQFRNIRIDASDQNAVLLNLTKTDDDEPIRINNRKIFMFIVVLVVLFIAAILIIFLAP
jgi:hypothetical protein